MLHWHPPHPAISPTISGAKAIADPREKLRAAIALSRHRRDAIATNRIDRLAASALDALAESGDPRPGLAEVRLALLSSHSIDHLVPAIRVAGLDRGLAIATHVGDYGLYNQALLQGDASLDAFAPQFILLALDEGALLPPLPLRTARAEVYQAVDAAVDRLRRLWDGARTRFGANPIQQTLLAPALSLFGSYDAQVHASPAALCDALNAAIRIAAREEGVLLFDLDRQCPHSVDGSPRTDPIRWHQAKQLINPAIAPLHGDLLARLLGAAKGASRKALILDLDNTLWGGVIGDDGIEGIKLGQGSADGEAFLAFQRYAAQLGERGVILAVCSKNEEAVARAAFEHPEMKLALADFACFIANWGDKAGNIRAIAQRIGIGLDSLVFVDDNPAERDIVRRELPKVAVPELPEDPALYAECVAAAGYFEAVALTEDDLARTRSYAANAARRESLERTTDMAGYLRSLDMVLKARPIDMIDRPRAVQLINKSNQFNLTTRRRTEQELDALLKAPQTVAYAFRLADRFGDNGLISVVIARPDPEWPDGELLIDTWLMSCRVLGRGVEAAVLGAVARAAEGCNASALIGEYRPSGRNMMVATHYEQLGFAPLDRPAETTSSFWRMPCPPAALPDHFINVEMAS